MNDLDAVSSLAISSQEYQELHVFPESEPGEGINNATAIIEMDQKNTFEGLLDTRTLYNKEETHPKKLNKRDSKNTLEKIFADSEKFIRDNGIALPVRAHKGKTVRDLVHLVRNHRKVTTESNKQSSRHHELKFKDIPPLPIIRPRLTSDNKIGSLDDDIDGSLGSELIIIEPPSENGPKKKQCIPKKTFSLDLLNEQLKQKSKEQRMKKQASSVAIDPTLGASLGQQTETANLKEDERPLFHEDDFVRGIREFEDDDLEDPEKDVSDNENSSLSEEDEAWASEDEMETLVKKKRRQTHIIASDDEQEDLFNDHHNEEDHFVESLASENTNKEDLLALLSGKFETEQPIMKKSRFIEDEAEEEDDRGGVLNTFNDYGEENQVTSAEDLYNATLGLIDVNDNIDVKEDALRDLYREQIVHEDLEETDELMNRINQRKQEREEEQELKKMLMSRRQYGKKNGNSNEDGPVSFDDPKDIMIFDKRLYIDDNDIENDEALQYKLWKAQTTVEETMRFKNPFGSFPVRKELSSEANVQSKVIKNTVCYRSILLDKSANHLDRLQELQLIPEKRAYTFVTAKKRET